VIHWTANPRVHQAFEILGYAVAASIFFLHARKRDPVSPDDRARLLAAASAGAAIGMRLLHWLSYATFETAITGGKSVVGGLLGGVLGVEIAKRIIGIRRRTGDSLVLPILAALVIGRAGCFLTGPIDRTAGIPTNVPWGIAIGDGIVRHPVALYEIAFLLLLVPFLQLVRTRRPEGEMFRVFMLAYLAFRLLVDFLKPDPPAIAGGLTAIQFACLGGLTYFAFRGSWVAAPSVEESA
jgi:prolipoprotein diacylglyceryltransferase